MHELYELKDKLCKELEEYGSKQLDAGSLEVVDKLSHAIKNLNKIIENYDNDGYSNSYDDHRMSYRRNSYARRRDSMGRYSRANDTMISELREMMQDAPDERTRKEFQTFIEKMERM